MGGRQGKKDKDAKDSKEDSKDGKLASPKKPEAPKKLTDSELRKIEAKKSEKEAKLKEKAKKEAAAAKAGDKKEEDLDAILGEFGIKVEDKAGEDAATTASKRRRTPKRLMKPEVTRKKTADIQPQRLHRRLPQ